MSDPRAWHQREHAAMRMAHAKLEGRSRAIGFARLACVAVIIVVLAGVGLSLMPPRAAWAALVAGVVFAALVVVHARVDRERDRR